MSVGHLQFRKVTLWRGKRAIVRDVTFDAKPGTVTAILGPNGSGKSTLLGAVTSAPVRVTGSVELDGVAVSRLTGRSRASKIGVLGQTEDTDTVLTAAEMVGVGLGANLGLRSVWSTDSARLSAVARALDSAGASELAERSFSTLSGGEQQRVRFARAIVNDPTVLVLDEPTNHLELRHQFDLLVQLQRSGRTVLIALHSLDHALRYCDQAVVVHESAVVAAGSPREVLTRELIRDVFAVDATTVRTEDGDHLVLSRQ